MAKKRGFETVRDMVYSLGAVGLFVIALLVLTVRHDPSDPVTVVDAGPVLTAVTVTAPFPSLVPAPLPGWRATSARITPPQSDPFRWHVGYVTPADEYAAVGQSNGSATDYLEDENAKGRDVGVVTIDGEQWHKVERPDGERRSLVLTQKAVGKMPDGSVATGANYTTLVTGSANYDELTQLASSLSSKAPVATTPASVASSSR